MDKDDPVVVAMGRCGLVDGTRTVNPETARGQPKNVIQHSKCQQKKIIGDSKNRLYISLSEMTLKLFVVSFQHQNGLHLMLVRNIFLEDMNES